MYVLYTQDFCRYPGSGGLVQLYVLPAKDTPVSVGPLIIVYLLVYFASSFFFSLTQKGIEPKTSAAAAGGGRALSKILGGGCPL